MVISIFRFSNQSSTSGVEPDAFPGDNPKFFKKCVAQRRFIDRFCVRFGELKRQTIETINRQLFFLWLPNAFEFDLRPTTIAS
jgi:hypothetical protein